MIAPLLVLALLQSPSVVELPDPSSREVTIQAVTRVGALSPRDQSVLRVLVRTIPLQTDDYIRRDMLAITDGRPVRMSLMPDHVRVSISVPVGGMSTGLSLLESLYRRASLRQEELAKPLTSDPDYWSAALDAFVPRVDKLTRDEAWSVYRKVFRADRTTVAVGGKFDAGTAQADWARRVSSWRDERLPVLRPRFQDASYLTSGTTEATILTLDGKLLVDDDVNLAGKLLAMIAIGSGKGSTLHRVWRNRNAWSYRQEVILWPTVDGWQPRLAAAMALKGDAKERAESAKAAVVDDIQNWTEADRARALGMAAGILVYGIEFSPLYVTADGGPSDDLEGRTFLAAYWRQKTGTSWRPDSLLASMGLIGLDDLKATALELVQGMTPHVLPGKPPL